MDPLARFFAGELPLVCIEPDGQSRFTEPYPRLILAGSFNPLHQGHRQLGETASRQTDQPFAYELTVVNAEKGELPEAEVRRRIAQFAGLVPLWLTRASTFPAKADLFPAASFIIGVDTAVRIIAPRFYDGDEARMASSLSRFRDRGCRFLVAGRADATGRFLNLHDIEIHPDFRDLFHSIAETDFRCDLSSTQLRSDPMA